MSFNGNLRITNDSKIRVLRDETGTMRPLLVVDDVSIGFESQEQVDRFIEMVGCLNSAPTGPSN